MVKVINVFVDYRMEVFITLGALSYKHTTNFIIQKSRYLMKWPFSMIILRFTWVFAPIKRYIL